MITLLIVFKIKNDPRLTLKNINIIQLYTFQLFSIVALGGKTLIAGEGIVLYRKH